MIINDLLICQIVLMERIDSDVPGIEPKEFLAEARILIDQVDGYYEAMGIDEIPDGTTWIYLRSGKRFNIDIQFLEFDAMFTDWLTDKAGDHVRKIDHDLPRKINLDKKA